MEQYIKKSALVAEIEKELNTTKKYSTEYVNGKKYALKKILSFLDTLETKEIGVAIPDIDDLLEEDGIDPYSKDAKLFKECYYTALEKLKEKKGK